MKVQIKGKTFLIKFHYAHFIQKTLTQYEGPSETILSIGVITDDEFHVNKFIISNELGFGYPITVNSKEETLPEQVLIKSLDEYLVAVAKRNPKDAFVKDIGRVICLTRAWDKIYAFVNDHVTGVSEDDVRKLISRQYMKEIKRPSNQMINKHGMPVAYENFVTYWLNSHFDENKV